MKKEIRAAAKQMREYIKTNNIGNFVEVKVVGELIVANNLPYPTTALNIASNSVTNQNVCFEEVSLSSLKLKPKKL